MVLGIKAFATADEMRGQGNNNSDEAVCEVCNRGADAHLMLLCDSCDHGYHISCLRPPLHDVPDGKWFCASCERTRTRAIAADW